MTLLATLVPLLVIAVIVALVLLVQLTPASLAASVERLARRVNLALDDDVRDEVMRFQRRRVVASALGALAAAGVVLVLVPTDSSLRSGAIVLGVFGGVAMGVAVAALLHARRAHRDAADRAAPSAGRLTPVHIADLVPSGERRGMPIALAVGAVLVLVILLGLGLTDQLDQLDPTAMAVAFGLLALAATSTLLWWALGTRIARWRPIGGGTQALAWSDALRSLTLRDMIALPLTAAIYAPLVLLGELISLAEPPVAIIAGAGLGLLALVVLVVSIVAAALQASPASPRNPAQHYQRRLWPELAHGGAR
ncbi:hypothetical protein [Microcella alkalica]|uniref:hypothetical protein n=1 Tax=Microcella alkalica TaxID=355930 RepID=UPI00145CABB1|nr:hypothetical protein [Microcella alkalica]